MAAEKELVYRIIVDASKAKPQMKAVERQMKAVAKSTKESSRVLKNFQAMLISTFATRALGNLGSMLDTWTNFNTKIRQVTKSQQEFLKVRTALRAIARDTFADLNTEADLFKRISMSVEQYNLSTEARLTVTEAVANSMRLMGGTAQEASATMIQLAQAMGSGRLQGDELRSILENNAVLSRAFAKEMGVAVGELKGLGAKGLITTDRVLKALVNNAKQFREEALKMPPTVQGSMTIMRNSFVKLLGDISDATGAAAKFGRTSKFVSENMKTLASAAAALGLSFAAIYAGKKGMLLLEFLSKLNKAMVLTAGKTMLVVAGVLALAAAFYTVIRAWRPINDILLPMLEMGLRTIGLLLTKTSAQVKDFITSFGVGGNDMLEKDWYRKYGDEAKAVQDYTDQLKSEWKKVDWDEILFGNDKITASDLIDLSGLPKLVSEINDATAGLLKKGDKNKKSVKDPVAEMIKNLRRQVKELRALTLAEQNLIAVRSEGGKPTKAQIGIIRGLSNRLELTEKLVEAQERAKEMRQESMTPHAAAVKEYRDSLAEIVEINHLVTLTTAEQMRMQELATKKYLDAAREIALENDAFARALYDSTDMWARASAEVLVGFAEAMVSEVHSIKDAWKGMLQFIRDVVRQITVIGTEEFVTKPLFSGIRDFFATGLAGAPTAAPAAAPAGALGRVSAPRVSVINVTDPNDLSSAMASRQGEQIIMNVVSRNRAILGIS